MKIEIEFEEVEQLRNEIQEKNEKIKKLVDELKGLDPDTLKSDAVRLAKGLFKKYMECVFRELGFEKPHFTDDPFEQMAGTLEHWLGDMWYDSKDVTVTIGANISNYWKSAFLRFGVKTEKKSE